MSTGPLVTLARVTFPHEAHLLKGLLESRGVTAFIIDEHLMTMQWMWETALGGVKVQVAPRDIEAAHEVLANYHAHRLAMSSPAFEASTPHSAMHFYGWRALVIACWATTGVVFPLPSVSRKCLHDRQQ
ncbi:putative signal transducing protein [Kushneria marisflavi]|uniref:DUF2007 domain-containing protein n=1 Tax=Kushneria marisflavi TaxID=157779 RepID=A0A240UQT9_9GAMM|nr:DUF2007 domain-containing protein [Kushneria marisflavi]ART63390.1 hypothetical protein B9H00_10235 [Kushneria marisflavi]RKD84441.1 putative signal transducing protein [Kushneria marisflavi]